MTDPLGDDHGRDDPTADEFGDQDWEAAVDRAEAAAQAYLAAGPLPMAQLVARLDADGHLEPFRRLEVLDGLTEKELSAFVFDVVLTDEMWTDAQQTVALISQLLEGRVFTHRLSDDECQRGVVAQCPDLVALDWLEPEALPLSTGGQLEFELLDEGVGLAGPPGWLEGRASGDLLAFTWSEGVVTVSPVNDADVSAPDGAEVEALRRAVAARLTDGLGGEADPLVLDALAAEPSAFGSPARPLAELLRAAGLERRGFNFGPAGQPWQSRHERHCQEVLERLSEGLESACCRRALAVVIGGWRRYLGNEAFDVAACAKELEHGGLIDLYIEYLERTGGRRREGQVEEFADRLVADRPKRCPAALVVKARVREWDDDFPGAMSLLRRAVRDDPDSLEARAELAHFEFDRGDLRAAFSLLDHPDMGGMEEVLLERLGVLIEAVEGPFRQVGRNDPCPCGSGRKFKLCCGRDGGSPLAARTGALMTKLTNYLAHRERFRPMIALVMGTFNSEEDVDTAALRDRLADDNMIDFAVWEGGLVERYLEARGPLLPADEAALLQRLVWEPRRLWEVTAVDPGRSLTLRDTASGEALTVNERQGSLGMSTGRYLLARVVQLPTESQILGAALAVPLQLRASAMALVDSQPGAEDLARWYGLALRPPVMVTREGEPMLLCEIVLDLPAGNDEARAEVGLDAAEALERRDGRRWHEMFTLDDGDRVIRGSVSLADGQLKIETNSADRADRLLEIVSGAVPGCQVVTDQRIDQAEIHRQVHERRRAPGAEVDDDRRPPGAPGSDDPALVALMDTLIQDKERQWVDESVPALGGLTPRQALDDPTRREDLEALLVELGPPNPGSGGFQQDRLRALLGLAD